MSENHKCTICKKCNESQDMSIFGFRENGIQYKTCVACRSKRRKPRAEADVSHPRDEEETPTTLYTHKCSGCKKIRVCAEANVFGYKKNGAAFKTCFSCRRRKRRTVIQNAGTTSNSTLTLQIHSDNNSIQSDQRSNFSICDQYNLLSVDVDPNLDDNNDFEVMYNNTIASFGVAFMDFEYDASLENAEMK